MQMPISLAGKLQLRRQCQNTTIGSPNAGGNCIRIREAQGAVASRTNLLNFLA